MVDGKCGYHHEGYCLKGLPGTPCEVEGCVARNEADYLSLSNNDTKDKSAFMSDMVRRVHQTVTLPEEKISNRELA